MKYDLSIIASVDERTEWGQVLGELFSPFLRDYKVAIRPLNPKVPHQHIFKTMFVTGYRANKWEIIVGPPNLMPTPGKKTVYFTRWDARVNPKIIAKTLSKADVVILPSRWDWQMCENGGVKIKPEIIQFGFNPTVFLEPKKKHPWPLVVGCTFNEKFHLVFDAFRQAFPNREDVKLGVRMFGGVVPQVNDERVEFITKPMQWFEVDNWFKSLTVYVTVKPNGAGLSGIQAMAAGTPVIGDATGSKTAYLTNALPPTRDLYRELYWELRRIYLEPSTLPEPTKVRAGVRTWLYGHIDVMDLFQRVGVLW